MATKSQISALHSIDLFSELSKRELNAILRASKEISFPEDHTIVKQGASSVGLHVILEGEVKVVMNGRTRAKLRAGEHFGEMSLIDGLTRSASVITTTPVRTLSLGTWSFGKLVAAHPSMARKLLIALSKRLREVDSAPTD
jgi:CRP/FNR family transcriptional regulator, cyclic AMP receptor protein